MACITVFSQILSLFSQKLSLATTDQTTVGRGGGRRFPNLNRIPKQVI